MKKSTSNNGIKELKKWPYIFLAPYTILYIVFFLYPTLFSFYTSLTDWDGLVGAANKKFIFFENYTYLLTEDPFFFKAVFNTFMFMVIYIPLVVIIGLLLAVIMHRIKLFKKFFQTLNMLPYITTPAAIGLMFAFMFDWSTGIVNRILLNSGFIQEGINWLGIGHYSRIVLIIILVWKNFGYYFLIYLAAISTIPSEITEAAKVDGASEKQTFFKITVPYLKPITLFLVVTSIVGGFQLFDEPMLLFTGNGGSGAIIGGPDRACLTGMVYFFDTSFTSSSYIGYGAAMLYVLFLIIVTFSIISFKIFSKGGNNVE